MRTSARALFTVLFLLAGASQAQDASWAGTYRNLSFNVDGAGGAQRPMRPLILFPDGRYTWGEESGTWSIQGGKLRLSERPAWGDATVNRDRQLLFEFTKDGKGYAVTMYRADDAPKASAEEKKPDAAAKPASGPPAVAVNLRRVRTVEAPGRVTAVAPLRDGSFIVASRSDNTYRRYEGRSGRLLGEFTVEPKAPPGYAPQDHDNRALAVTPDDKLMLVANYHAHNVSIIDLAAKSVASAVAMDGSPYRLQSVTAQGAWVIHDRGVTFLDISKQKAGETIEAEDVVCSGDGQRLYLLQPPPDRDKNPNLVIKSHAKREPERIDLGAVEPYDGGALALSPDGKRIYVLLAARGIMALDAATGKPLAVVALPIAPTINFMALSPDGTLLALWVPEKGSISTQPAANPGFVIHRFIQVSGQLALLDANALQPMAADVAGLDAPQNVCFSPDSKFLYVPDRGKGVTIFER